MTSHVSIVGDRRWPFVVWSTATIVAPLVIYLMRNR